MAHNNGTTTWCRVPDDGRAVDLAVYLNGVLHTTGHMLDEAVVPGASTTYSFMLRVPEAGDHTLRVDLVAQTVCFFSERGTQPQALGLRVIASPSSNRGDVLLRAAIAHNPWFDWPTQGVSRDARGQAWPLF